MTASKVSQLIEISSDPIARNQPELLDDSRLKKELKGLLSKKNGFYTFESSLHVFPSGGTTHVTLERWNSADLWRADYGDLANGLFFFAEDAFGGQFAISDDGIYSFDPETGKRDRIAPDVEGWVDCILVDFNYLTGYPLANEWQKKNGALRARNRLVPKIPFVCGGKYAVENLVMVNAVDAMKWRADLARQLKDLPDGSQIQFKQLDSKAL